MPHQAQGEVLIYKCDTVQRKYMYFVNYKFHRLIALCHDRNL